MSHRFHVTRAPQDGTSSFNPGAATLATRHRAWQRLQNGFTLVELMIVVTIVGILAAIALPAFQDYSVRAKMSEAVLAMSACRSSVSEIYQSGASAPAANSWGCESGVATRYVQKIQTDANGAVTATVTSIAAAVDGSVVTLIPLKAGGTPATTPGDMGSALYGWACGGAGTTVNAKYLPASCRG